MTQTWFQEFVDENNTSQDMLFELLTAANYMGIKPLLDLACLKGTIIRAEISSFLSGWFTIMVD